MLRGIIKSKNSSSHHTQDEKSINNEDSIYDSSEDGKNEIEELITKTHIDEDFRPGRYTSRHDGRINHKLQFKAKFKAKKIYKCNISTLNRGNYYNYVSSNII